jgi:GTP cyclohydrolase I
MQTVYLSLGSNIGDRQYYLREAVRLLSENPQIIVEKQSQFYETSPVGDIIQDDFINLALKISTLLEPLALLAFIHEVEARLNRERKIHWGPRTIDIDILFYDGLELNEENLKIPHPELFNRLFVLIPLLELIDENFAHTKKIKNKIKELLETEQEVVVVKDEKIF